MAICESKITGYRFCPTDEEIVDFYLQKKLKEEPLSHPDPILSRDLFGDEEPSQIFDSLGISRKEHLYFYTHLRNKFKTNRNIKERCAGKGNWKMQSGKQKGVIFNEEGIIIGSKITLNFFDQMSKRTPWIMTQYTSVNQQHLAICRVHFHHIDGKPGAKRPRSHELEEEQPSSSKRPKVISFVQNEDQFQPKEKQMQQTWELVTHKKFENAEVMNREALHK
ncbi:hypothetical protein ACHQM5_007997 [Ranunculus cassubicifolius]